MTFPQLCWRAVNIKIPTILRILEEEFEKRDALERLKAQQEEELQVERQRRENLEVNLQVRVMNLSKLSS